MPQVPTYDNFQASPGALPQVRMSTPTMPNVAGIQAKEMGQGLQQVGQVMSREALQAIEEANTLRAEDAYNRLRQKQIDLSYGEERGAFRVEGANVLDRKSKMSFADEYIAEFDKAGSEIAATLANDEQRKRFNHRAQASRLEFGAQLQRHQAQEIDRYSTSVMKNRVETETRISMLNPYDVEAIGASIEHVRLAVGAEMARKGIPADEAIAKAVGGIHAGVIATALNDDRLDYARQYLTEFGDEIDPKDRMTMTGKLDARDKEVRIMAAAEEAFVYHSDNLVSGESLIRAKFKDDPKAAHAALVLYEDRSRVLRAETDRVENEHRKAVKGMLVTGKSWRDVMKSQDWKAMDPDDAFQMFEQHRHEMEAKARAASGGAGTSNDKALNATLMEWDMKTHPEKYQGVNMINVLTGLVKNKQINASQMDGLLETHRNLGKLPEFRSLATPDAYLTQRLQGAKINGKDFADLDKKEQDAVKARAVQALEPLLAKYQAANRDKASDKEMKDIVDTLFTTKTYRDTIFPGGYVPYGKPYQETVVDPENAAKKIGGMQAKQRYEQMNPVARARIEAALRKEKQPITPESVLEEYELMRSK